MGLMPMSACSMGDAVAVIATAHATSPIAGIYREHLLPPWFCRDWGHPDDDDGCHCECQWKEERH